MRLFKLPDFLLPFLIRNILKLTKKQTNMNKIEPLPYFLCMIMIGCSNLVANEILNIYVFKYTPPEIILNAY